MPKWLSIVVTGGAHHHTHWISIFDVYEQIPNSNTIWIYIFEYEVYFKAHTFLIIYIFRNLILIGKPLTYFPYLYNKRKGEKK